MVSRRPPHRVASVSFVNARPLIHGLERDPRVDLRLAVPSALLELLRTGRADVALLPVIDYQRARGLIVLPAGGIGSDGATLTVRIFSRVQIEQVRSLACDPDSHTSVALARILLANRHGIRPEFCELSATSPGDDPFRARLLIGDKVVCDEPRGFEHQLDLGAEWKAITGLPFVFATWMATGARPPAAHAELMEILSEAKRRGVADVERIVAQHAVPRGWPADLARQYLTKNLRFDVGAAELESIRLFHRLAAEESIIASPRPLAVFGE